MKENACLYYHNLVVFAEPKGIVDEFLEVVLARCKCVRTTGYYILNFQIKDPVLL